MAIVILKDENVKDIMQRAIKRKGEAYKFLNRNGLLKEADYIYHEWKALTEVAELLGLRFRSITDDNTEKARKVDLSLSQEQLEKLVILIYFHFNRYKFLHVREFEKILLNVIENE